MKRLLYCVSLLAAVSISQAFAGHKPESILNVKMFDHSQITVEFDNQVFRTPSDEFRIKHIRPGRHHLKVIKHRHTHSWGGFARIVFNGYVDIAPGCEIFSEIDWHNRFVITEKVFFNRPVSQPACSYGCAGACDHVGFGTLNGYEKYDGYHGLQNGRSCRLIHMNDHEFMHIKRTIADRWFDSSKRRVALQLIESNHFTSFQIRELLLLFDFESSRLVVAKRAFHHVCDQNNYYVVYDVFDFDSSVDNLNRFIAMR